MSMILFFTERTHENAKIKGSTITRRFFLIFYISFRDFPDFRSRPTPFLGDDVILTSWWCQMSFFLSMAPDKVVLRFGHRILLHIDQSSFSGLWVNLPPPNHLTSIESPNHNTVQWGPRSCMWLAFSAISAILLQISIGKDDFCFGICLTQNRKFSVQAYSDIFDYI